MAAAHVPGLLTRGSAHKGFEARCNYSDFCLNESHRHSRLHSWAATACTHRLCAAGVSQRGDFLAAKLNFDAAYERSGSFSAKVSSANMSCKLGDYQAAMDSVNRPHQAHHTSVSAAHIRPTLHDFARALLATLAALSRCHDCHHAVC